MKYILLILPTLFLFSHCSPTAPRQNAWSNTPTEPPNVEHVTFGGGEGSSVEEAILVEKARNSSEGIAAEYVYLAEKFGEPGIDWTIASRGSQEVGGRRYDHFTISRSGDAGQQTLYFDITEFYGKY